MKAKKLISLIMTVLSVVFIMCIFSVSSSAALSKITSVKTSVSDTKVTLSWSKVSSATAYQVFQYNSESKKWTKVATSKTTKATVTDLSPATNYVFKVRAYKKLTSSYEYSPYTSSISVKTKLPKPAVPVATAGPDYVNITWTATENATGYQIELYDYAKKEWVRKRTVTKNSVKLTGLVNVKSYKFRIRAYNTTKKLVYSPYSEVVYFTTKPNTPTGFTVDNVTATSVSLSWDKVAKVTGYYIYVNEYTKQGKATSYKVKTSTKNTSITLSLNSCTYYRFRVMPYFKNSSGKNIYGKYATSSLIVTPPAKITSFSAADITNNSVTLTWKTQPNATSYKLYQRTADESSATLIATLPSDTGAYTVENLNELSSYRYYIKVCHTLTDGSTRTSATAGLIAKTDDSKVKGVSFTRYKSKLSVGSKYTFKAQATPSYALDKTLTYKSSKTSVATVSSKGVVTAVAPGTTYISAKTNDGGFTAKIKLTVAAVKSTSISVPSTITLYVNESSTISPVFKPANTTDKSFTVTGSNHTYSYKGGLLGLSDKTDTCVFSDYITVDESGRLFAKKTTVEPETGESFSFYVTVRANDTGIYTKTKIKIVTRKIKIAYSGTDMPWYYSNTVKLTATVSGDANFTKDSLIWTSNNKKVATVSSDGTVNCVGVGDAVISATSPDEQEKFDYQIHVGSDVRLTETYFEQCKPNDTYNLNASVLPAASTAKLSYSTMNPDIVSVDQTGTVTFLKNGTGTVVVSASDNTKVTKAVFTSEKWIKPELNNESLFITAKNHLNSIKTQMPALIRTDSSAFSNFVISNQSSKLTPDDFEEIFAEFANESERYIPTVDISTADYNTISSYYSAVPVSSGQSLAVLEGIDVARNIKSVKLVDSGSYTYDIVVTLKTEYMTSTNSATTATAHGKIFDILSSTYINEVNTALSSSSMDVSFSNFAQTYHDSSVTITINKATGLVENVLYDMNINIAITNLEISAMFISMFDSDLSFSVNNKVKLEIKR